MRASPAQHIAAQDFSYQAFYEVFGREPTISERQYVQAIGCVETTYGAGWHGAGVGSNNMGAIQSLDKPPCNPETSFLYSDTHEDGQRYQWCYAKYPTPLDGWIGLVRRLYIGRHRDIDGDMLRQLADEGDFMGAVAAQRASGYFELALSSYQKSVDSCLREMSQVLGEPYAPKV